MSSLQELIDRVQGVRRPVASAATSTVQRVTQAFKRKVPAVYDLSAYGYDVHVPMVDPTLTGATTFTYSASATVHRSTTHTYQSSGTSATTYVPMLHSTDSVLSNLDTGIIYHEGDNTAFNQDYLIEADMTAAVHQIQFSFAVAMNVASWTDATLALASVSYTIASYMAPNAPITQPITKTVSPSSAFSALSAAGTHLFIVRDYVDIPMKLRVNGPLTLNITINTTGTRGSDTYQVGLVDMYPVGKSTAAKRLFPSEIIAHIHPLPEHADELAKYSDMSIGGLDD